MERERELGKVDRRGGGKEGKEDGRQKDSQES